MGEFDPVAWELFLRKMIAYNLRVFGLPSSAAEVGGSEECLIKLKAWNMTQIGLHSMMQFQVNMKKVAEEERGKFQFEHEMRELGDEDVKDEFNGYFDSLVEDVTESMKKYSESVKQLEELLELEKETLFIKRKVATFSLDYDDDLASEAVSLDLFNTGATNLLGKTKEIQVKKHETMQRINKMIGAKIGPIEPISTQELQPFLDAIFPN